MQRKALKQQLREIVLKRRVMQAKLQAKEDRLLSQLDYVENEQQMMMNEKLKNLKELASITKEFNVKMFSKSLIDVVSKQIVFLNLNDN